MNGDQVRNSLAVIGLGYVGLPLAQAAVKAGWRVVGFDANQGVVHSLRSGTSHVDDVSDEEVKSMLLNGFIPTASLEDLAECQVYVICVPTPLKKDSKPDLSAVVSAGATIAPFVQPGNLIVLESTSYPGTTDSVLRPILEQGGHIAGKDFNLAFSPERIDPGNQHFRFENTPKVVGGLTAACRDRAVDFYSSMVQTVVPAAGLREAELAKLLENTYRHVNIALVNEMAKFCHDLGIDVWNVIECASTKPFGFHAFRPGPGVGGHCIPIDPNYLSYFVRTETGRGFKFVELAQEINRSMPSYVAHRVGQLLNTDSKAARGAIVLVVGVTYKPDIADTRESPAVDVVAELRHMGAEVSYLDPRVPAWEVEGVPVSRVIQVDESASGVDCVVVLQRHSTIDVEALVRCAPHVLDCTGQLSGVGVTRL